MRIRFITQNLRLLFLFLSTIPMMAWAADIYFTTEATPDSVHVYISWGGDVEYIKYSIIYEDGIDNVSDEFYTEQGIAIARRPVTITAYTVWLDSVSGNAEAKYYGFSGNLNIPYQSSAQAPAIIPALPGDATVTYANSVTATPKNTINTSTGLITVTDIATDTYSATFTIPARPGAGPDDITILNDQNQNGAYDLGGFTLTVTQKPLTEDMISLSPASLTYDGNAHTPYVDVKDGNYYFTKGSDYTVTHASTIKDVGSYPVTVTATANGKLSGGPFTKNFSINYCSLDNAIVTLGYTTAQYTGSELHPSVSVALPGEKGNIPVDASNYDVTYSNAINVGTATVTIKGKGNYNGSASATFNIVKAAGSISYATTSISKKMGDAAFTNTLTNTGDGKVSYTSSNTAVATVNATTGAVTIKGNGTTTITATVTDGSNYTYATKTATYTITVESAEMSVSATGYNGTYDGKAHGITVTAPSGATVKYGTAAGTYNQTSSPTYTNAGTYTVYYQVTKANYTTVTGSQTVVIAKASGSISFATASVSKTYGDAAFTNALTKTGDGTVSYSTSNAGVAAVNATTGKVTVKGNGTATITATVTDGTNYTYATMTAKYTVTVGTAAMDVSASGYSGTYDGKAHGITVTAPSGATVKYGTSAGTYNQTTSPTYTNAGTYTVYYQVTKDNYTTVTGSQTVVITKASGSISYATASVSKTYGDAAFTNALTKTGDGTVSYSTSNAGVAAVNATTGKVTLKGNGTATITATVKDGTNYTYATKTAKYTVSVGTAAMDVSATGYSGTYDGNAHGITVTAPSGATVKYGTAAGTYNQTTSPTYTNAGTYTVYYQVTKDNYTTVTGSQTVVITKASGSISYATASVSKTYGDAAFTNALTKTGDGTVSYASSNKAVATVNSSSGKVTLKGNGTATITATVKDGTNYTYATKTAKYTLSVGTASMDVTATGYSGTYDGNAHGITVTAPSGATVKYGESEGSYNLTASPAYTDAGTYTVYYEVSKSNYATVTGSQSVVIKKAAGSISYAKASVSKTYGDAAFTNALTKTGDGTVSYASSNKAVATVNSSSGKVTLKGNGTTTITATVKDGTNYTYATKTAKYTLSVGTASMDVTATGYSGTYDGNAHGITVTAPSGATVKYGESEGSYNLTASPTYTDAGTYTVYYEVSKSNYATVTGSQTVVIKKAAGSISYAKASVSKTYGDAAFTNALTKTGDGTVSYASSNKAVATVNSSSGKVTLKGNGTTTITATVKDGTNYTYATKTAKYTLSVGTASMDVTATGYSGTYDGNAHGITVTAPSGATVKYGTAAGTYNQTSSPTYTNAGTYTVYYQVTMDNYSPVTGAQTVTINKANAKVQYVAKDFTAKIGESFETPQVTLDPADLVVTYSSSDTDVATVDAQTGEVSLVAPGQVTITATFAGNENYNSASDYYILTVLQRDIDPIDEDVVYTMDEDDFFFINEDGIKEEIKLDNTVIYDILFTLDIIGDPSETDGYDETEHCIVLNHPLSTNDINRIIFNGIEPGTDEYAGEYTGLTFKVPAGKGYVIIDSQTDGDYQMMVKIGNLEPVAFNHAGREKDSVLYECTVPTWVYVYNGGTVDNVRMQSNHRSRKTKGHVMIYSITRSSSGGTGIELLNSDAIEIDKWYDLQGNRINRPIKKGIYILRGKKVIVR